MKGTKSLPALSLIKLQPFATGMITVITRVRREWGEPLRLRVLQADFAVLAAKNVQLGLLSSASDDLYEDACKDLSTSITRRNMRRLFERSRNV